jgi:hypothetical protein
MPGNNSGYSIRRNFSISTHAAVDIVSHNP